MSNVVLYPTPFDETSKEFFTAKPGDTIARFLFVSGLEKKLHEQAVVLRLNGAEMLSSQYNHVIAQDDLITLHVLPQGGFVLLLFTPLVLGVKYYMDQMMEDMQQGADTGDASPTYSITARGNGARIGSPKPVFYGRVRTYPDLGALPYTEYEPNGDQVLYQLFEVRQGECVIDVDDMRFEDTPLVNFEGYEVEIIQPGEQSTLYPGAVAVSSELDSIEIGPTPNNPGDYKEHYDIDSPPDASYVACDVGQEITRIAVDVVANSGLYRINPEGKIRWRRVGFRFEARKIDDDNNPLGDWFTLGSEAFSGESRDAIRRTFTYAVAKGRYEVRPVRTVAKTGNEKVSEEIHWVGLKGFLTTTLPLTTTTRVALKIRASEQLGRRGASKFNLISEGKIPVWAPLTGWSEPEITANPAWVFADILHNAVYGGGRGDSYIDLAGLHALASQLDDDEIEFHGGFDTQTTVWDALTKVAAVAMAKPVDRAGVYYMVRDVQASVPAFMFTHSNIVKDSFKIDYASIVDETPDAYRVNFYDREQDYRQASFVCALPGSEENNIKDFMLFGCTDKNAAQKWGMYLAAVNFYRRQRIEFSTGIEGYLPFYGDTVSVSHYLVGRENSKQVSGDVIAFDGIDTLTLSEKISDLVSPYIILRRLDGSPTSAYPVEVIGDFQARINEEFESDCLQFDAGFDRPHFMCGEGSSFYARIKIDGIKAQENGFYQLSGFVDAPEVYEAADGLPTPPVSVLPPIINIAPVVSNLRAFLSGSIDAPVVQLNWNSKNSDHYLLEVSSDDGVTWARLGIGNIVDTKFDHTAEVGELRYRVAGVSLMQGQWVYIDVDTSDASFVIPAAVTGLALSETFVGEYLRVQWSSEYITHKIAFYSGSTEKFSEIVSGNSYSLHASVARANGLGRSFTVKVWSRSLYDKLSAAAAELSVNNPLPGALDNLSVVQSVGTVFVSYDWPTATDIDGVSVWASTTPSFTPSASNRIINRSKATSVSFEMPADQNLYIRVAAQDVWGDDANYSGQYTLDHESLLDKINGKVRESHLFDDLNERINLVDDPVTGLVKKVDDLETVYGDTVTAATSASEAIAAQAAAELAAGNADASADSAASSVAAAASSASAASTSATNAATYKNDAQTAATAASSSATNAATSAGSASTSATNASNSATSAASSASSAGTSATNAANSASAAGGSASAAAGSASSASTSATNASNSASAANTAKVAAESARDTASGHASAASTSASTASTAASAASSSASAASSSASTASTEAASALTYKNQAATSATNAANSASAAAIDYTSLTARLNNFSGSGSTIEVKMAATASVTDGYTAQWSVKTSVSDITSSSGRIGGFGLYNNGSTVQFLIAADTFAVYSPGSTSLSFAVESGKVVMDAAFLKNASIGDAKIGTLTVDTVIQTNAMEDYIQSSVIPATVQQSGNGQYFGAFVSYENLSSVTVPATTRTRKNVGFIDVALKCTATASSSNVYYKLFEIPSPVPTAAWVVTPVGGTSISMGAGYIAQGVTNTSSSPPSLPTNWGNISNGNTIIGRTAGGAVLSIGIVGGKHSSWQTQNLGGGNYAHYLHVEMSTYLRVASGTIANIAVYPYNWLSDAGGADDVVNFTANKLERLSATLSASIRSGAARTYYLGVGVKTSSGIVTAESNRFTLLALR